MSRLLLVDCYLLVKCGGLSANEKGEILASNDKMCYAFGQEPITELAQPVISVIGLLDF